jgi:hypothetical protein
MKEKFEDTKVVMRIKEGRATQWPNRKNKETTNDLQNTTQKTKDRIT